MGEIHEASQVQEANAVARLASFHKRFSFLTLRPQDCELEWAGQFLTWSVADQIELHGRSDKKGNDAVNLEIISQFKTMARILPHTGLCTANELVMIAPSPGLDRGERFCGAKDV